jgi:TPR repeat protein
MQRSIIFSLLYFISSIVSANEPIEIPPTLLQQVEDGNAEVAYFIASQYDLKSIEDSENNYAQLAQEWMTKAAEMQYPQAMFDLGEMLESKENDSEALIWYQKAGEFGIADAFEKIAYFHIKGLGGLSRDCIAAYKWYEKAELYDHKLAFNDHAWALATSAYKVCRSPEKALRLISKLISLYKQEYSYIPTAVIDTQAAVYAGISDFNKAIELQKLAIETLGENHEKLESYKERLDFYENRKAWVQKKEM